MTRLGFQKKTPLTSHLKLSPDLTIKIGGIVDRVDEINNKTLIIDYTLYYILFKLIISFCF